MRTSRTLEPRWLLAGVLFIAGIFLGGLGEYIYINSDVSGGFKLHPPQGRYQYINPLLAVDIYANKQFVQNKSLDLQIEGLINRRKQEGAIQDAAVYFRDIDPGLWVGIRDDKKFSPGRLLKLPIMIAYYKIAESNPKILEEKITYPAGSRYGDTDEPKVSEPLTPGTVYAVGELIQHMIVYSDNEAANLLFDHIDRTALNEVFSDLGIDFKEDKETRDFIPIKLYSLFFRVLYNASYLTREYSEKALTLLVEADNSVGLGAGLPKNLAVANREGSRKFSDKGGSLTETYDCGIVYYANHPYLLCAVVVGKDENQVSEFMKELGQTVYAEMSYRYGRK